MYHILFVVVFLVGISLPSLALPPPHSAFKDLQNWPFANDGITNPPSYYQRYRRDEYPTDKPFFQWWYYYFSDFENQNYFLISFGIDETHLDTNEKHFTIQFGAVDAKTNKSWHKCEQFDLSVANITNYFDIKAVDENGEEMYHLSVINNDTYHLTGSMNHSSSVVSAVGIDPSTPITFDLTLSRINGWYGQQDVEKLEIEFAYGEIAWNPYAHNSLVEGKITVGDQSYTFVQSQQYRGYGDMNWGERFPAGDSVSDGFDFPWGWFTVNVPNEDPALDFAVVIGSGSAEYGVPLGRINAAFADFRFNGSHLGIRHIIGWDGHEYTLPIVVTSSDGELYSVNTTASNFATYQEGTYNFKIPLCQTLTFETTQYHIFLNFTTSLGLINRLVFQYADVYFSDFEALGSQVHVVIDFKNNGQTTNLYNFVTSGAGYEYGYQTQQGYTIIDSPQI